MHIPNATQGRTSTHCEMHIYLGVEPKVECTYGFHRLRKKPFSISQSNPEFKANAMPSSSNETNSRSDEEEENSSISKKN